MYKLFFKRVFDYTLSLVAFFIILPIFLLIMIILLIVNKGKPFFRQIRVGKNEKVFSILKFKTMKDIVDIHGNKLPDKKRVTGIGRFLRKTSLDELPQLLNIISGKMSLIGPRPLPEKYLPFYNVEEKIRHSVLPGMTGLAQSEGRNRLNWDDKLKYDIKYVNELSFILDVKIFFKTIHNVLSRKDVSSTGVDSPGNFDVYRKQQMMKNK